MARSGVAPHLAVDGEPRRQGVPRLLVIDDEYRIADFVCRGLAGVGFDVEKTTDPKAGLQAALDGSYDLVILDLLMPELDGRDLLVELLKLRPDQPVIILSALGDTANKVRSLELGAQDYVVKPFAFEELLARINARLRSRAEGVTLRWGGITLDLVTRRADVGAGPVALSEREFLLLRELMRSGGQTLSNDQLLERVWGYHFDPGTNVVDVYVRRLRAKLGLGTIQTVRGEGHRVDLG
ncbi:MAG TPA: response regulator transcription factor [Candidatus Dormibacteraeota bacterium]|jgi:DNA-binding response OmpR family regulator